MSLLSDRINEAIAEWSALAGDTFSNTKFAQHCGVKKQTVGDWRHGRTKTISGVALLKAAKFLDVNPTWLASGSGQKKRSSSEPDGQLRLVSSTDDPYTPTLDQDAVRLAIEYMDKNITQEIIAVRDTAWRAKFFTALYDLYAGDKGANQLDDMVVRNLIQI